MSQEDQPSTDRQALRLVMDLLSPQLFQEPSRAAVKRARVIISYRLCEPNSVKLAQIQLLETLTDIAMKTENAEVWAALFRETRQRLETEIELEEA